MVTILLFALLFAVLGFATTAKFLLIVALALAIIAVAA